MALLAPPGFKAAYLRTARSPASPEALSSLLGLVGYEVSPERIARWTLDWRVEAEVYAVNVHLRASDNRGMRKCPKPRWLPEAWQGLASRDALGVAGGTVLR